MKSLTREFRRVMANDEQNYLVYADITLSNNTTLNLTNSEIWTGGFSYEEAVSQDDSFTALGSAIIGSAEVVINNIYEEYSAYDFINAKVVLHIGMQFENRLEKIKIGTYRVDDAVYNGATIRLSLLDYMEQFDRPYPTSGTNALTYPATLSEIVHHACLKCGVTFAATSEGFPHYSYEIPSAPSSEESITYREVLSWVATIAGCYLKCNPNGQLTLGWFDTTLLDESASDLDGGTFNPWSSGTVYDGGTFNPWSEGTVYDGGDLYTDRNVNYITNLWSQNIAMDDVVITGVTALVKDESENATSDILTFSTGTSGYIIKISDNEFITKTNAQTIVNWLGTQLIGLRFRKLSVSQVGDLAIEAGDVGLVIDRKQNIYRALITRMSFSVGGEQTIVCGADTPSRNSATRFSSATKSYVESRKLLKEEQTAREQALEELAQAIQESSGVYTTITSASSGKIYYLHDKPNLSESKIVWKMTAEAWAVTNDWQGTDSATTSANKWNAGMLVNGTVIASILSANGVNADWINSGTITGRTINGGTINGATINAGGTGTYNAGLYVRDSSNSLLAQFTRTGATICGFNIGASAFYKNKTYVGHHNVSGCILSTSGLEVGNGSQYTSIGSDGYTTINGNTFWVADSGDASGYWQCAQRVESTNYHTGISSNRAVFGDSVWVAGDFSVSGYKNRAVDTEHYGTVGMNAFETAGAHFADLGSGIIGDDGAVTIFFDPRFAETVELNVDYQVFITKTSEKEVSWVEKKCGLFIVHGEKHATFDWMLVCYQRDYVISRMEHVDKSTPFDDDTTPIIREDTTAQDLVEQSIVQFNYELEVLDYD